MRVSFAGADAQTEADSVRSSGELARASTRTAAVVQPPRRRRRARRHLHRRRRHHLVRRGHPRRPGCNPRRLPGARGLARRDGARDVLADRHSATHPAAGPGDLGARDPRPHPRRLARRIAPARRAVPHLHGGRVVPASQGGRRAGGHVRHDRRARTERCPRSRHRRRLRRPRPVLPPCGHSAWRCATGRRRPTPGCARRTNEPRPSARAPPGCWPRNVCASPRSCTTSSLTRCRSSPCRPASAPTCSTTGRSRHAPRSKRSPPRRGAR